MMCIFKFIRNCQNGCTILRLISSIESSVSPLHINTCRVGLLKFGHFASIPAREWRVYLLIVLAYLLEGGLHAVSSTELSFMFVFLLTVTLGISLSVHLPYVYLLWFNDNFFQVGGFLKIEFWKFFIYSGYKFIIMYKVRKYFLSVCGVFNLLTVFWGQKFLTLM